MSVLKSLFKLVNRSMLQPWHRQARGMTLGTRTLVLDEARSRVLLVRHTYAEGWMLPGGGVERGETIYESAVREIREEAGILVQETPRLLGFCSNQEAFPGDHIAVLLVERFAREAFRPNGEIAAAEFFPVDGTPAGTTAGTRRRISEVLAGQPAAAHW